MLASKNILLNGLYLWVALYGPTLLSFVPAICLKIDLMGGRQSHMTSETLFSVPSSSCMYRGTLREYAFYPFLQVSLQVPVAVPAKAGASSLFGGLSHRPKAH